MSHRPIIGVYRSLAEASADIVAIEALLPEEHPAWHALAHARKEYGHACGVPADSGAMEFHLGIVARDIRVAREMFEERDARY